MKKNKAFTLFLSFSAITCLPVAIVSCSTQNSLDDKINNILNKPANQLFEARFDLAVKNFNDIFNPEISKPIIVEKSSAINDFENSLSKEELEIYKINYQIESIDLPNLESLEQNKIKQLKINLIVSGGPVWSKKMTYTMNLESLSNFEPTIQSNNLTQPNSSKNSLANSMMINFKSQIEQYISNEQITTNLLVSNNQKLNIALNPKNINVFWNDLEDKILNDEISLYIYASNSKKTNILDIKSKSLYFKISNIKLNSNKNLTRIKYEK